MKRLLILILLLLYFICCQKLFKEDIQNTFHLKTKEDYAVAMAGLYNRLFNGIMENNLILMFAIANEDDMNVFPLGGSETDCYDCEYPLSSTMFYAVHCGSGGGCIGCGEDDYTIIYKLLFQTIGSANDIISKAGNSNLLKSEFKKIIGEAYYIRAYCYFRLARLYGQVPLVDDPDVDFTLKKPSFSELYNFIASDLLKAMDLLPKTNNEARVKYETPHRGTAKALLAEVYLTMGGQPVNDISKYADAARVAGEVIDSATYFGFGLMPDLADLWNGKRPRNSEIVFAINFLDSANDISNGLKNLNSELFAFTGYNGLTDYKGSKIHNSSLSQSYSQCIVAPDFFNSFPNNYRKDVSFQNRHVPAIIKYSRDSIAQHYEAVFDSLYLKHYDTINYCTSIAFKKFYSQFSIADSILLKPSLSNYNRNEIYGHYTGGVVYLFRYAQTLLTYAEAKARSGALDAFAYEAVNQVRRRANKLNIFSPSPFDLTSGLSPQQFADSVVQERAWELCAEPEGRWFDMLRLRLTKDLVAIKQHQDILVYPIQTQNNNFLLPVPAIDTLLNPNLR
jgi:starch-binding outer membrane protein, SusD/RagB family